MQPVERFHLGVTHAVQFEASEYRLMHDAQLLLELKFVAQVVQAAVSLHPVRQVLQLFEMLKLF